MKNIFKFATLSAVALAICAVSTVFAADSSVPEIKNIQNRGILKVGVKNAVVGFSVEDPLTGDYKGFEDDLARLIADDLGVDVEFTAVTTATRTELIDSGDLDVVLATFTISDERKTHWDFTSPYYTDYVTVLVEDKSGIKNLKDMMGKKVGVSSGSTSARALVQAMIDKNVIEGKGFNMETFDAQTWSEGVSFQQYDDFPAISTALSAGQIDAICVDKSILNIYKLPGRSYIEEQFAPQSYGAVTKKGSGLSPYINGLIESWQKDGTVARLMKENGLD